MKKRDYYKYELKKGNEVLYVGITKDPDRRHTEHRDSKRFGHMLVVGNKTTKEAAEEWETKRIAQYARNHGGNLPRKNKTGNGK